MGHHKQQTNLLQTLLYSALSLLLTTLTTPHSPERTVATFGAEIRGNGREKSEIIDGIRGYRRIVETDTFRKRFSSKTRFRPLTHRYYFFSVGIQYGWQLQPNI